MSRGTTPGSLAAELEAVFARGAYAPLKNEDFRALALRVFAHQFEGNRAYRRFCERRGGTPGNVTSWEEVPVVPTSAFKHVRLQTGDGEPEALFRTSGTSAGTEGRGVHPVPRLSLYRSSLLPMFQAHVLPEGERLPLLSLIPPPSLAQDSSLSAMIGVVADVLADDTKWLVDPEGRPDVEGFLKASSELASAMQPAMVVGTAFGFVHLLDALSAAGRRVVLPEDSRIMETGGFKGRSRVVARDDLYDSLEAGLGVPAGRIVNEYGMTELLSQLYDPVLREGLGYPRRHVAPPWLKVRALDPITMSPLPSGRVGMLAFFDLANLGSVSHVLSDDLGSVDSDGIRLQGRTFGAEPRGCSLNLEDYLPSSGNLA